MNRSSPQQRFKETMFTMLQPETIDLSGELVFLPVRHHSPACAWHVRAWIRRYQPVEVLIEGPADANPLLGELASTETKPPVALYGFVRGTSTHRARACWYPFCSHSPEYVAIVEGLAIGAHVEFIDVPSWWQATMSTDCESQEPASNVYSDGRLRYHRWTAELCKSTGARDFDELWDRMFEANGIDRPSSQFWSDVATYCAMVRAHSKPAEWDQDGTTIREQYMAASIEERLEKRTEKQRPVLVLTGGFHRTGLRDLLFPGGSDPRGLGRSDAPHPDPLPEGEGEFKKSPEGEFKKSPEGEFKVTPEGDGSMEPSGTHERKTRTRSKDARGRKSATAQFRIQRPTATAPKESDRGIYLCPYGDRQLDRWSGYQSGMPAPAFYRSCWESALKDEAGEGRFLSLLGALGRFLRKHGERVSTADLVAAERMLRGLSQFRGHPRPAREDLRDAVRSTWIKGSVDDAHGGVLTLMDQFLVGSATGIVTPAAGSPPLVHDFEARLKQLRLPTRQALESDPATARAGRQINLDIHRRPNHRERSAFLHQLKELEVPYAKFVAGPDFAAGMDLDRVREIWQIRWRPEVLGLLVERSLFGATVAEAAQRHLLERFHARATHGAEVTVSFLTSALVMALPNLVDEFVEAVREGISNDGNFANVAKAFSGLVHLVAYRSILSAERYSAIEELTRMAYRQAVWLLDSLPGLKDTPSDRPTGRVLQGLSRLRHAVLSQVISGLDADLFFDGLLGIRPRLGGNPRLEGAVLGILRQGNRVSDEDLEGGLRAAIQNTLVGPDSPLGEFLAGLFSVSRHTLVEKTATLSQISACIADLPRERFLSALPSLRLAFTNFSPIEIRRMAETIEGWGARSLEPDDADMRTECESPRLERVRTRVNKALEILGEMPT